jgi:hypothetical protein
MQTPQPPDFDSSEDAAQDSDRYPALTELVKLKREQQELADREKVLRERAVEEAMAFLSKVNRDRGLCYQSDNGSILFKQVKVKVDENHQDLYYLREMMELAIERWKEENAFLATSLDYRLQEAAQELEDAQKAMQEFLDSCPDYWAYKKEYEEVKASLGGFTPQLQVNLVH